MLQLITTKPGNKYRSIRNPRMYRALRRQGHSKESAARITNARSKSYTLDQLEAYVCSPCYDPAIAQAIATRVPALPRLKGEQIAPGITRIRGNLCNVHGKYGKCPGASATPEKPAKGAGKKPKGPKARKPVKTPEQRAAERQQQRQANVDAVKQRMADTDTGLSPGGVEALTAFADGKQPDALQGEGLARMGLAERAEDGSFRMTPTGRAAVNAMRAGDYQRAVDAVSRGADQASARQGRQTAQAGRQQATTQRRTEAEAKRQQRAAERARAQAEKKPAKSGSGGSKKPAAQAKPVKRTPIRQPSSGGSTPSVGGVQGVKPKPKPVAPKPEAPEKQETTPALAETARNLSEGKELSDDDTQALIRNGLARLNKDGELILTAAGQRAIRKKSAGELGRSQSYASAVHTTTQDTRDGIRATSALSTMRLLDRQQGVSTSIPPSFAVFKDARGRYRWVAQSSTAYQDRDKEIVSTKALADDVARADKDGSYGPLRWWHSPGLDLGDCDFNAMHGRVLIESGTFRSEAIALKVARAAPSLEISLGFLHLPTEPDADGVFHHIRRFERSLVPRGKASNRFTAFAVKEPQLMDATKVAALKQVGFSDSDIADILARAEKTEKTADDAQTAYKADEPADPWQAVITALKAAVQPGPPVSTANVVLHAEATEKAAPPAFVAEAEATEEVVEEDAMDDMPMDEPEAEGGLTLSPEDLTAIGEAVGGAVATALQQALAPMVGLLDIEKKMQSHVESLMGGYQATKDAETAETKQQIAQLQTQVAELTGDAPAVPYRASQAKDNILTDAALLAQTKQAQNGAGPWDDIIKGLGLGQPQP